MHALTDLLRILFFRIAHHKTEVRLGKLIHDVKVRILSESVFQDRFLQRRFIRTRQHRGKHTPCHLCFDIVVVTENLCQRDFRLLGFAFIFTDFIRNF